ncbi:MAG TPA: hypothetical protein VGJ63_17545 [Micromonosporaceae bacterium]|jgi:hypothetical protein
MGRIVAGVVLLVVAVVVVGWVAMAVVHALVSLAWYLILGALVVGGGYWLYRRARRAIGPETRNRRRLEAALRTRRTNDR